MLLEAFDAPLAKRAPAGPPPGWAEGHAVGLLEGRALGEAEARARAGALTEELAQALADMAWTYAEARAEVLAGLQPLFAAVTERLLPTAAHAALGPWLAEAVADAARADTAVLTVAVHPSQAAAVAACLGIAGVSVVADDALGPHAARVKGRDETLLDLDACLQGIAGACPPSPTQARGPAMDDHPLRSLPVEIVVSVGRARPLVRDLLALGENAVLPLDRRVDDPVELWIGDRLIARGELMEAEGEPGQLAVRLTEVPRAPDDARAVRSMRAPDGL
jgi:flagellar motor switch protein FliN/FliY